MTAQNALTHTAASSVPPANPAERIVRLFGGVHAMAGACGRDVSQVYRWLRPRAAGGFGGRVPHKAQERLLSAAKARGLALELADFLPRTDEAFQ
jgi:hypothetical protein